MKKQLFRYLLTSIFLLCCFSLLISCGSGGDDDEGAPPVGSIEVAAGSTEIVADGASHTWISATVKDSEGQPVEDDTLVSFTTTSGTMSPTSARTYDGVARANLISSTKVGTATVTATAIGTSVNVTVIFVPGPVKTISLTATPDRLESNGVSISEIRAQVTDANGNAVSDGEVISFSITSGTGTLSAPTATTSGGVATVTYTASGTAGTETVTVRSTNGTYNAVNITLIPASIGSVTVSPGSFSIVANGISQTLITAFLKDQNDNSITDGTTVSFSTTAGTLSSDTATTINGVATVMLTSPPRVGSATIIATSGGVSGNTTVEFVSGAVGAVSLTATPNNLTADGTSTSTIRAEVTDVHGNAVSDGEVISFSITSGSGILSAPTATTSGGVATVTYTASTTAGTVTVKAESTNGEFDTVDITLITAAVGSVTANAGSVSIVANGTSSTIITAEVKNTINNNIVDGTTVNFTTTAGTLSSPTATTVNGIASVTLTSSTNVGIATIIATAGGVSGNTTVEFVSGAVGAVSLTATPNNLIADGVSTSEIRAQVTDAKGNAVSDGEVISFSITSGSGILSALTATTGGGVATVTYTASTTAGTVTIQARSTNNISSTISIILSDEAAGAITLSATPDTIPADGNSSLAITATLTNNLGQPVLQGTSVTFITTLGTFSNGGTTITVVTPDTSGTVTISLMSGTTPGTAQVTASGNGVTQSIGVNFTHGGNTGVPVAEEFALFAEYYNISGLWIANLEDKITASVGDVYGNAVKDNTPVYFKTYNTGGLLAPDCSPTATGFASSTLYSTGGPVPLQGFVSVTSELDGAVTTRVTSIEVTPDTDNHIIYAGTNGGGVYKSTDSGATWENISRSSLNSRWGENWIDPYIKGHSAICVDPDDHNAVYAATGYLGKGNVFRSLDGGMNWNSNNVEEWYGLLSTNTAVLTVLCDGDDTTTDYPYVWAGTEGQGILYATDGAHFQPSGGIVTPIFQTQVDYLPDGSPIYVNNPNTGNGYMTEPTLWYSSKTEDWTATCQVSSGTATTPEPDPGNAGDGVMSAVNTTLDTKTEDWTVTYGASVGTVTGTSKGNLSSISLTKPNAASETWTLTAMDGSLTPVIGAVTGTATPKGTVTGISVTGATETETFTLTCTAAGTTGSFSVVSNVRGSSGTATAGIAFTSSRVNLIIGEGSSDYAIDETFIFTSTVTAGTTFSVYSSEVGYYTNATVGTPYDKDGLLFQINEGSTPFVTGDYFRFTTTASWQVIGTVSGLQPSAETGISYTSDEVAFTIWAGATPFETGDKFTFSTTGRTTFWQVQGAVSGLQDGVAQNNEFYRSDNYEVSFQINEGLTPFITGDEFTFHVEANKINHGRTVWDIERVAGTHGSTTTFATLYAGTATGVFWSTNSGRTWEEPGNFTGDYVISLALHPTSTGGANDVIYAGTQNGAVWVSTNSGTGWTQYASGMEAGAFIKDVLLDPINNFLYAITYKGPVDAATGSVYVHAINADGSMGTGGWKKVSAGLTGTALHAMAIDDPADPGALFVGGEGINFYKATSGLSSGNPTWLESKDGLTNLIMARMPVLFSGACSLDVRRVTYGNTVYFTVYLQDLNGNPPIIGSKFEATYTGASGDFTFYDIDYPDCYTHQGTFSDPGNGYTNNPYTFWVSVSSGDEVSIVFTPANSLPDAPGSSGSKQTLTYKY